MTEMMATLTTVPPRPGPQPAPPSSGACRDAQVEELTGLLRSRPTAALSLGCFDTVLWRATPKPTDVFFLIGHRLKALGLLRPTASPELFMKLRIQAELEARAEVEAQHRREVDLATIYSWAGWRRQTRLTATELAHHELLTERSVTTADPYLLPLLHHLCEQEPERELCIVSDTCYDAGSVRSLLDAAGLAVLRDVPIFTSSDHGLTKAEGLFEVVGREMEIDPGNWVHVGKDLDADVEAAVRLGVAAVHLPPSTRAARRTLDVEGWARDATEPSAHLDPAVGDSGLTALRARISRQRPRSVERDDAIYWHTGAMTLGPVITGFAEWVQARAGDIDIDIALCVMRPGQFLAELVNAVPEAARRCTAVPFWASPEACLRATLFEANRDELDRLLSGTMLSSPGDLFPALGLVVDEVPGGADVLAAVDASGRTEGVTDALIELVLARQDVRERVVERSATRRKAHLEHVLAAAGDLDRPVAIVDLGGRPVVQALLGEMAGAEGIDLDLRGLYLFTPRQSLGQFGDHAIEGFVADPGSPSAQLAVLVRATEVLEAVTTSSDGPLLEILPDGRPKLAPARRGGDQDRQRRILQSGITSFQRSWYDFCADNSLDGQKRLGDSADLLRSILSTFLAKPGPAVARAFSDWRLDDHRGPNAGTSLVPEVLRRCAGYLAPEHLAFAKRTDLPWVGAAAALSGIEVQASWLQEGRAGPGTFLTRDHHGQLVLELLAADGTSAGAETPLLWKEAGTGVIAWRGCLSADRIALHTSGELAVLRLDRLRLERADGSVEWFGWGGSPRSAPAMLDLTADRSVAVGTALVSDVERVEISLRPPAGAAAITGVELLYRAMPA